ncbi:Methylcrotonoyl-CoA carboxylase subunit alpha, mitochondrial [Borealophlyctis nickersoniae]|nr:Methylcrotonoyl-CoA carboxylase subunit alpha, mitochondrial [Borealophlyctis nickersoniae]
MRTAKKLGIKTVAVYSEADKNALHVEMADEAYLLGPAASSMSYLRMDKIISIAQSSKAQAIHPGYGFLSENADFAEAVGKAGLVFIGPPVKAIVDMGSKSASKHIMEAANVPVVPGYHGTNQSVEHLKSEADKMGYPVLIKAIKGGGGKGMRIVEQPEDFELMLESSRREAIKSFGDDNVLVEKYLVRPRHVEVQVFADTHGDAVYLFERDCSVQRRYQKVLEEAPAPGLTPELRASLGEKAVAAAKAVGYVGAGTVEFILDTNDGKFYFMEMNTRLQVEHPITEMVTGTDLVEWQLEVAAGNPLPKTQQDLRLDGHAFEARIYAENPAKGFLPDTGPLLHLSTPAPSPAVRIETGVRPGDEVSVHYDPMISKLVVKAEDRVEALRVLRKALDEFEVVGPNTNIDFLKSLASHPSFIEGDVETGFIKKHETDLFKPRQPVPPIVLAQIALSIIGKETNDARARTALSQDPYSPWTFLQNVRLNHPAIRTLKFKDEGRDVSVAVEARPGDLFSIRVTDTTTSTTTAFDNVKLCPPSPQDPRTANVEKVVADIADRRARSTVVRDGSEVHVFFEGSKYMVTIPPPAYLASSQTAAAGSGAVVTPMPCKISQVNVKPGQKVEKGVALIILEAMKMEHVIKSPHAGVVKKVHYKVGDLVGQGKQLLSFE